MADDQVQVPTRLDEFDETPALPFDELLFQTPHQSGVQPLPAFETASDDRVQVDERDTGGQTRQFDYAVIGDARDVTASYSVLDEVSTVDLIGKRNFDGGDV